MIKIRQAKTKDKKRVMELWNEAFGSDEPYYSWYFNNIYQPQQTYCLFVDEIMIASIQYAPRSLSLHTNEENVAYLVGVCTSPEYQHQGYGHSLLKFVIDKLRSSYSLLMLNTDIPNYYQPLGFSTCYWLRQQKFTAIKNPSQEQYWQKGTLNKKDIKKYNDIYHQMTAAWDGYLIRDQQGWSDFFTDFLCDKGALYLSEDAYLLWMINDCQFFIKEIGYTTLLALEKAIQFAAHLAQTNGYNTFIWNAPLQTPINGDKIKVLPHLMVLSTQAKGSTTDIAQQTMKMMGAKEKLWANEIT